MGKHGRGNRSSFEPGGGRADIAKVRTGQRCEAVARAAEKVVKTVSLLMPDGCEPRTGDIAISRPALLVLVAGWSGSGRRTYAAPPRRRRTLGGLGRSRTRVSR